MVLSILIRSIVGSLEFDADGKIVTALPPAKARNAGMPGAAMEGYELDGLAVAANQQVSGDPHAFDLGKEWVLGYGQRIGEKPIDGITTETTRGQTNTVYDHQIDVGARRTLIVIGRWLLAGSRQQPRCRAHSLRRGASAMGI